VGVSVSVIGSCVTECVDKSASIVLEVSDR
jgi:hypothetical protein